MMAELHHAASVSGSVSEITPYLLYSAFPLLAAILFELNCMLYIFSSHKIPQWNKKCVSTLRVHTVRFGDLTLSFLGSPKDLFWIPFYLLYTVHAIPVAYHANTSYARQMRHNCMP